MIYKATKLIKEEMERQGLKYSIEEFEDGSGSTLLVRFTINNGPSLRVKFISLDDKNDVAIRLFRIVENVAESKINEILKAVNECNCEYRYLKFILDEEHDVNIEYDLALRAEDTSIGAEACEILVRIVRIVDEVYPKFMKIIWS